MSVSFCMRKETPSHAPGMENLLPYTAGQRSHPRLGLASESQSHQDELYPFIRISRKNSCKVTHAILPDYKESRLMDDFAKTRILLTLRIDSKRNTSCSTP